MKLIITGHDYSGKSTMLRDLWGTFDNRSASFIHLSYREPTNYEFYNQTLEFSNFLMDRCFLDELIYPEVFNREPNLTEEEAEQLMAKCEALQIKILILECSDEEIERRIKLRKEKEEPEVLDNILLIKKRYREIASKFGIPIVDTTNLSGYREVEEFDSYNIMGGNNG